MSLEVRRGFVPFRSSPRQQIDSWQISWTRADPEMSWKWEEREVWKNGWERSRCLGEVGVRFGREGFGSESGGKQRFYIQPTILEQLADQLAKEEPRDEMEVGRGRCESGWTRTGPGVVFNLACPIIIPFGSIQLADLLERRWGQAVLEAAVEAVLVVVKGFNSGRVQARGLNSHLCVL